MASQTSPTTALHQHHVVQGGRAQPNGHVQLQQPQGPPPGGPSQYLKQANEAIWMHLGTSPWHGPVDVLRGGARVLTRVQEISPNSWASSTARLKPTNEL